MFGSAKPVPMERLETSVLLQKLNGALLLLNGETIQGPTPSSELGLHIRALAGISVELASRVVELEKRLDQHISNVNEAAR